MQQTEQFIQAIADYFDQSVATATDDQLFAAGYLRGHVDLAIGTLQVAAEAFNNAQLIELVEQSLVRAIDGGELNSADEALVRQIWTTLQQLAV
jgi:hypothetical protein